MRKLYGGVGGKYVNRCSAVKMDINNAREREASCTALMAGEERLPLKSVAESARWWAVELPW